MLLPLFAALMLLVAAPPALAGDHVLVVKGDRIEERWDPYLAPDTDPITPDPPPAEARPAAGAIRGAIARALGNGRINQRQHDRFNRILTEARQGLPAPERRRAAAASSSGACSACSGRSPRAAT